MSAIVIEQKRRYIGVNRYNKALEDLDQTTQSAEPSNNTAKFLLDELPTEYRTVILFPYFVDSCLKAKDHKQFAEAMFHLRQCCMVSRGFRNDIHALLLQKLKQGVVSTGPQRSCFQENVGSKEASSFFRFLVSASKSAPSGVDQLLVCAFHTYTLHLCSITYPIRVKNERFMVTFMVKYDNSKESYKDRMITELS